MKKSLFAPIVLGALALAVGLQPGDRWCLCAARWQQALLAGKAPQVVLNATNEAALLVVSLDDLKLHAIDLN